MEPLESIPDLRYRPLDQDQNEIRLLRIFPHDSKTAESQVTCELFHASLDCHPSFKALSYTWGSPDSPLHDITLNSQRFKVRDNLYHALHKFQSKWIDPGKPLVLWVDAICIDQSNVEEQSHEVARMKFVYEMAEQVFVWLGVAAECCEMAFEFVPQIDRCSKSHDELKRLLSNPDIVILNSLSCLSHRPYWQRMWIVQELTVAREIIIYCGDKRMQGRALLNTQRLLQRTELRKLVSHDVREELSDLDDLLLRGLPEIERFKTLLDSKESFSCFECVRYHYEQRCRNPRDMIYGLIALANSKCSYRVDGDYLKPVAQVYTELAKAELMHSNRLDLLSWRNGSNDEMLPSWVPDWSVNSLRPLHIFLDDPKTPQFASWAGGLGESHFLLTEKTDELVLKGIEIGTIEILGLPHEVSNKHRFAPHYINPIPEVHNWWDVLCSHGCSISLQIAFMRTMLLDRISNEALGLWSRSDLFRAILHPFLSYHSKGRFDDPIVSASLKFRAAKCEELTVQTGESLEVELQNLTVQWWNCLNFSCRYLWDRRFFINQNGTMGLVPKSTLPGDIICIAPGCSTPLILRRVDVHYIFIGEAYIDQHMKGEAIERLARKELKLQEFLLR